MKHSDNIYEMKIYIKNNNQINQKLTKHNL